MQEATTENEALARALFLLFFEIRGAPAIAWGRARKDARRNWRRHAQWVLEARALPGVGSDGHALFRLHQRVRGFKGAYVDGEAQWGLLSRGQKRKYRRRAARLRELLGLSNHVEAA